MLYNVLKKSLLTLYREMNLNWGARLYGECGVIKERSERGVTWLLAGMWN
jgi:hypothetical protein